MISLIIEISVCVLLLGILYKYYDYILTFINIFVPSYISQYLLLAVAIMFVLFLISRRDEK